VAIRARRYDRMIAESLILPIATVPNVFVNSPN
jgi:hypothetical protein